MSQHVINLIIKVKDNKRKDPIKIQKSNFKLIFSIKFFTENNSIERKNSMKSNFITGNRSLG